MTVIATLGLTICGVIAGYGANANTTFVNGSTIVTNTGSNVTTAANKWYRFHLVGTAWIQY